MDLPRLEGRTFVITGANSGIGFATARELARAGAHVVLAVRDMEKGERAAAAIEGDTEVRRLDLADLASVRRFAADIDGDIDTLVNNAGVMHPPLLRTADGFELQIGTNHLGHFALTNLLLPRLRDRVVVVASTAHRYGRIRLDDLNWEGGRYDRYRAYGQSKLANLLFASELQRRLAAAGSSVRALSAHPGWARTDLLSHSWMRVGLTLFGQSAAAGALPTVFAATHKLPGDTYVGPGGPGETRGPPALVGRARAARDADTARRLWELSEELTGVRFPAAALSPTAE